MLADSIINVNTKIDTIVWTLASGFFGLILLYFIALNIKPLTTKDKNGKKQVKNSVIILLLLLSCLGCYFIHKALSPVVKNIRQNEVEFYGKKGTAALDIFSMLS